MSNEPTISPVSDPQELEQAKLKLTHIRFDCLIKMFDCGIREIKTGLFGTGTNPLPPQWFKSELRLTLEAIKYEDERAIGRMIKQAFLELERHIQQYEGKI